MPVVLKFEGGYANHPSDPGGETNFGISKRSYPALDIAALTVQEAVAIYRKDFWFPAGCEDTPWPLTLYLFDCHVNSGLVRAKRFLVDLKTPEEYLVRREAFYVALVRRRPHATEFLKGWLRRIAHLRLVGNAAADIG